MKAVILDHCEPIEHKPLKVVQMAEPKPKDNEILIRITVCGACHTDLDEVEGRLEPSDFPRVLGHQVVGTVAQTGKYVTQHKKGDRIGVTWLYQSCQTCPFCKTGRENLCKKARWTGKDADGGYAEYMVIEQDYAYRLPDGFSDTQAGPLLCAGVIGYRTFRLADIQPGDHIGLLGFGASAHIVIQILKHQFPDNPVYVFTKTEHHAAHARDLGAVWTGRSTDEPPVKLNKIMDFTPVGECVRDALGHLEAGGRLVINAIRKETPVPPLDYAEQLWLEREIKSVANVTRQDALEFLPLAAKIPIRPAVEQFDLEQANEVLYKIKHSQLKAAGVLRIAD